jgi:hypothetical protein
VGHLETAVAGAVAALRPAGDRDWSAPAGGLRWTCDRAARHLADDLIAYAGQLVCRAPDSYLPFRLVVNPRTPPAGLLDVVEMTGALLVLTVRTAPPDARGYHS